MNVTGVCEGLQQVGFVIESVGDALLESLEACEEGGELGGGIRHVAEERRLRTREGVAAVRGSLIRPCST